MIFKEEFDSFLDEIRPNIINYLQEKGFDTSKNFHCLNPDHEDSNASMTCRQAPGRGHSAWCYGCSKAFDIFDVYALLENKVQRGPRWMKEVVLPLATKYGIHTPIVELTHEQQFCQDLYHIYDEVASLIDHKSLSKKPGEYVKERGWTEETLQILDIGCLDYKTLTDKFDSEDLQRFGLNKPDVFDANNLIFTIRDSFGRAIRFFARRFADGTKWHSTTSSGLLVDVWGGKGHLYNAHLVPKRATSVIVVEGQPDAVTLYQAGTKNVVALCGCSSFSEIHEDTLAIRSISEIILALDGDQAGQTAVEKLLAQNFVKTSGIKYSVVNLPNEHDPDSFVRENGIEQFSHLVNLRLSSFRYLLTKQDPNSDIEETTTKLVPYIASNPSEISREVMARDLSLYFGETISVPSIMTDIRRADQSVVTAVLEKQKFIVGAATRQAQQNIENAREIFRDATQRLDNVEKEAGLKQTLEASFLSKVQNCKQWGERDRSDLPQAYKLAERNMILENILSSSDWATGQLIAVGAVENMGKSSFVNDLAWQIAANPTNRARVFIQTLDDSADAVIKRLVCQAYGSPDLSINMVANPSFFYDKKHIEDVYDMREEGYTRLTEVITAGRLTVKDASDGKSVSYAETQLQHLRKKYPDDNLVYVLDNFHNVTDWDRLDLRQKFTNVSKYLKRLTTLYRCTIICTAEYRKGDPTKIGNNEDLAEARSLKFDANIIIHIFSDSHALGAENANLVFSHQGKLLPRVIARMGKNKVGDYKGDLVYDFYPGSALFYDVPADRFKRELQQRQEELKTMKGKEDDSRDNNY